MNLTPSLLRAFSDSRARLRIGYPWWLRFLLARNVIAITIGHTIYVSRNIGLRSEHYVERLMRHELAHVRQVNRLGLPRFLWRYVTEFLRHLRRERSVYDAYRSISFEIEAAAAEDGL